MLQNLFISFMAIAFNPGAFIDNLYYMGVGMLAIIFVMGVLIGITTLLNKFFSRKKNDKDDE